MFGNQNLNEKGFRKSTIGESCIIRDSERIPITSTDREPGPYPYYGANGIQDYVKDYIFDGEFVLMAEDGGYFDDISRPNCYYVSGKCWVNNHAHILQPKECLNIHYLDWSLKYRDLTSLVNGSTRAKLTQSAMRGITVLVPPIELQNEFADFIKQVDKSKLKFHKLTESYDALIKSRFIEMFGNIEVNDKGWDLRKLSEVALTPLHYGSTASAVDYDGKTRYVRITDIETTGGLNSDFKSPSEFNEKYLLNRGDILFARSGSVGLTYEFNENYESIFAGYLIRFVPDITKLNPTFVYYFTRTDYCQSILIENKRGGVQMNVNAKQLGNIIMPVPPIELQNQFVDFVKQVNKSKFILTAHFTFLVIIWIKYRLVYYKPNTLHTRIICLSHSIAASKWKIPLSLRHVKL